MVVLLAILPMDRVLDGIQVHRLAVHLRHVGLVALVAVREAAFLGVGVTIESTVVAGIAGMRLRL